MRSGRWNPGSGASQDKKEEEWSVLDKPRILNKQLLEGRSGWEGQKEGGWIWGKCPIRCKSAVNSWFLLSVPGKGHIVLPER